MDAALRRSLRSAAHHLKPQVIIGHGGLSEGILQAINKALEDHELIKVKFNDHKDMKDELIVQILGTVTGEFVQLIGNIVILYRRHPDPHRRKIDVE